jgi:hypothetical protein
VRAHRHSSTISSSASLRPPTHIQQCQDTCVLV